MVLSKSSISKVQQIVNSLTRDIKSGVLKVDDQLPSINQFSEKSKVARDTVERAYKQLRTKGYIASYRGRGYFVRYKKSDELKVLLIFNNLSSFKRKIYESMIGSLGKRAKVDLQIHHYNPKLLKAILEEHLDKYDYYVVMPHFFSNACEKEYLEVIEMVPPYKLILVDKDLPQLTVPYKAVYQDFKGDISRALDALDGQILKYKSITLVLPEGIHHPKEIVEGVVEYCVKKKVKFYKIESISDTALRCQSVYIVTDDDLLAQLLKRARKTDLVAGKDIGVISFNETVFKELLDITVISTDFVKMGQTVAKLILDQECSINRNPFMIIPRGSL